MLGNAMIMSFMKFIQGRMLRTYKANKKLFEKIRRRIYFHSNKNLLMLQYLQYRENIKILGCKIATKLCGFLNIVAEFYAKTTT
jgi:hypothetical protein